jgi:hypothetical protein
MLPCEASPNGLILGAYAASQAMTSHVFSIARIAFCARRQPRVPVRSERDGRLLPRSLRQTCEQHRELGLTTRIRLGQDRFETLPDGFDAQPLIIGNS